jgi:hypothetical protein
MRVFTAPPEPKRLGPDLERAKGDLKVAGDRNHDSLTSDGSSIFPMMEVRYSVALKTTWKLDFPVYSLVTMTDSTTGLPAQNLQSLGNASQWDLTGIHPSVRGTGVAAFAFRIQSLLRLWEEQWSSLIDEIGRLLNADVSAYRPN